MKIQQYRVVIPPRPQITILIGFYSKCAEIDAHVCHFRSFPSSSSRICPIFQVSNVTGENLNYLKTFLNLLSCRMCCNEDQPAEFQIDETYSVPVCASGDPSSLVSSPTSDFYNGPGNEANSI